METSRSGTFRLSIRSNILLIIPLNFSLRRTRDYKPKYFGEVLPRHALRLSNTEVVTSFFIYGEVDGSRAARADTYNYTRVTEKHNYLLGKSSDRLNSIRSVSRTRTTRIRARALYSRSIQISPHYSCLLLLLRLWSRSRAWISW